MLAYRGDKYTDLGPKGLVPSHFLVENKGDGEYIMNQTPIGNLHALLIGINTYIEPIPNLSGCVNDMNSIKEFLCSNLSVPESQIISLEDNEATRFNIIDAIVALSVDPGINRLDPILIYYAGHGASLDSPLNNHAERVQSLVPCDAGWKYKTPAIPDYILADLLADLAAKKGNNITVILDSCHSASSTRGLQWPSSRKGTGSEQTYRSQSMDYPIEDYDKKSAVDSRVRAVKSEHLPPLTEQDDDVIRAYVKRRCRFNWRITTMLIRSRLHGYPSMGVIVSAVTEKGLIFPQPSSSSYGFSRSHTLLAACGQTETANERDGRGLFTTSLVQKLRSTWLGGLTPRKLFQTFPQLDSGRQNPVCEGNNANRGFFCSYANDGGNSLISIPVQERIGKYLMRLGEAQGVLKGSTYDIYEEHVTSTRLAPKGLPLTTIAHHYGGTFTAEPCTEPSLYPFYSWCRIEPTAKMPTRAYAKIRLRGVDCPVRFKVFMSDALKLTLDSRVVMNAENGIVEATSRNDATIILEIDHADNGKVTFELSSFSGVIHKCYPDPKTIGSILLSMTEWYWHLFREPMENLKPRKQLAELELHLYRPGETSSIVVPEDGLVNVKLSPSDEYILKLRNLSGMGLYPYLFYFSTRGQSIRPLYLSVHGSGFIEPPLMKKGELTFGQGNDDMIPGPLSFQLAPDVGYFRLFLTTLPGDFEPMAQASPFSQPNAIFDTQIWEKNQYMDGLKTQRSRSARLDFPLSPIVAATPGQDDYIEASAIKTTGTSGRRLKPWNTENQSFEAFREFYGHPTSQEDNHFKHCDRKAFTEDEVEKLFKSKGIWAGRWEVISLKVAIHPSVNIFGSAAMESVE
ncbi:unnamed protein product [Rhizoctonia solani]|uniref:Peptidase C14 caspase domain-containing protein n=1 Tax=Rhizoctonia solani TaxID=456999 RepID=A0A8H2W7T4_9AGAM|nr:unnamed protein product [Rhizoctonia solani]